MPHLRPQDADPSPETLSPSRVRRGFDSPRRRSRALRSLLLVILAGSLAFGAYGAKRFHSYVFGYVSTAWNPRSISEGAAGPGLGYYYLDWRGDWRDRTALRAATAEEGVVQTALATVVDGERRQDPVIVIQSGLSLHDLMLEAREAAPAGDPELETAFRNQVEWVAGEGLVRLPNGSPVWPCYWTAASYGLDDPWISAMTQGQAISLLLRAHESLGDPRYLDLAGQAVGVFFDPELPIVWREAGGADVFLEEYPTDPPSHVLNGALCAWLGLWDYVRVTGDARIREFAQRVLTTLEARIDVYQLDGALTGWTRYDALQTRPTSPGYQEIHAALAEAVAAITGDPAWGERAARWRAASQKVDLRVRVFFEVLAAKTKGRLLGRERAPQALSWQSVTGSEGL